MIIKRGDIFYADLRPVVGSEQGGVRPVLIIQNDIGNRHSPTVICAAITSKMNKAKLPTHVEIDAALRDTLRIGVMEADIDSDVDARRISRSGVRVIQLHTGGMCHLDAEILCKVDRALAVSLDMGCQTARAQGCR